MNIWNFISSLHRYTTDRQSLTTNLSVGLFQWSDVNNLTCQFSHTETDESSQSLPTITSHCYLYSFSRPTHTWPRMPERETKQHWILAKWNLVVVVVRPLGSSWNKGRTLYYASGICLRLFFLLHSRWCWLVWAPLLLNYQFRGEVWWANGY